jgi:putative aldouronate transport system substrate-binding protein
MNTKRFSRRNALKLMGAATGSGALAAALAACGSATPAPQATAAPADTAAAGATAAPAATEAPAAPAAGSAAEKWAKLTAKNPKQDWTPTYPAFKPYDPVVEIICTADGGVKWKEGESQTNNPYTWMREALQGIKYTPKWEAYSDVALTKLKADIAANDPPEMFCTSGSDMAQYVADGVVEDITDIWEATASSLVKEKKLYPKGDNWIPARYGDKIYGIAFSYGPAYNVDNIGYIRQDWLDKVNLKVPTTVDELTAAMKAFKDAKLGSFGINACKNLVTWHNSLDTIFGAYGVMPGQWRTGADGKLAYDSIQPAVKTVLGILRQWYADGLIDPDFYTKSEGDVDANIAQGKVGIRFSPWWAGEGTDPKTMPDAKWSLMDAPKGPDGKQGRKASGLVGPVAVFKKGIDKKKLEAAINELNFQMDLHVNWEKYQQYGHALGNGTLFVEGYEYVWDGDNVKFTDQPGNIYGYANDGVGFTFPLVCYPDYQADVYKTMINWWSTDVSKLNKAQKAFVQGANAKGTKGAIERYQKVFDTINIAIDTDYKAPPSEKMAKVAADMSKLELETLDGIVAGTKPLDSFDEFVTQWKAAGGDTWTEGVNAWKASQK